MKLAYFSAVVACFSLPLHKLDAQTFWEGSAFGMSDEQVKKLFPDAHAPKKPGTLGENRGVELLRIDKTRTAENDYEAQFFFKDKTLVAVHLEGNIGPSHTEKMLALLRAKYGTEASHSENGPTPSYVWNSGKTIVIAFFGREILIEYEMSRAKKPVKI